MSRGGNQCLLSTLNIMQRPEADDSPATLEQDEAGRHVGRPRKIIHIDADCFYAAVEMREDPSLYGKPVAVGGSPRTRGVVATCNYEARSWGVHSALSTAQALKKCPDLIVIPPRMELYRQVSQKIHAILQDYTELIEPLSLDEAFLDVTDSDNCRGSATLMAQEIRSRVWQDLRLVVSAGVAPNKFLAKIASDWRKPNGLFVITPEEIDDFVVQLPVAKLHGVGRVTAQKLARLGIDDCARLREFDRLELVRQFGKFGERLWQLARGIDMRPVEANSRRQSVSVEETYSEDLPDLNSCLAKLPELMASLQRRMQRLDEHYRIDRPHVKIKFHDFTQTTLEQAGALVSEERFAMMLAAAFARGNKPVRLLGIGVRLLDLKDRAQQLELALE